MKEFKYISHIGSELEGYWKDKPDLPLVKENSLRAEEAPDCKYMGEINSPPFPNLEELFVFNKKYYPSKVGQKCGNHYHISLKSITYYSQLMAPVFYYEHFLPAMKKWGEDFPITNENFWNRLNNKNIFCVGKFIPEIQVVIVEKIQTDEERQKRYTHLNYCWGRHKTVECRLFPMFHDYKTAESGISALTDCIENYLDQNPPLPEDINDDVIDDISEIQKFGTIKLKPFNLFTHNKVSSIKGNVKRRVGKSLADLKKVNPEINEKMLVKNVREEIKMVNNLNHGNVKPVKKYSYIDSNVFNNKPQPVMLEEYPDPN